MKISIKSENNLITNPFRKFLIHPFNEGLFGFGILFVIIVLVKFLNYIIDSSASFKIDTADILLASLGFICFFLISILNNFNDQD